MKSRPFLIPLFAIATSPCVFAQVTLATIANQDPTRSFYRTSPVGDVNDDGVPDVSVSGPGYGAIFSGATGVELHTFSTLGGTPTNIVIGTLDRFGDLDGDGFDDVVFGAPDQGPGGHVRVHSGKTGATLIDLVGDASPTIGVNFLGYEVVGLGDVNADGTPDFGASRMTFITPDSEAAFVYSGATGAAIFANFDTSGAAAPNIARAGDVNGDGRADVLVAYTRSPELDSCDSRVFLLSGNGGTLLRDFADPDTCSEGTGLLGGADLDGDSVPDIIVGSTYGTWSGSYFTGSAIAYSGATGAVLFKREGVSMEGNFGASMAIAGDLNGDGVVDLACGEPDLPTEDGNAAGVVHVFSGGAGALFDVVLAGPATNARFGTSLCAPGDIDGDGLDDLAIVTPSDAQSTGATGTLTIFSLADAIEKNDRFVPGSTLVGEIVSADQDDVTFSAIEGMKLTLTFSVESGNLAPRVKIESSDGKQALDWSPKPGDTSKKTFTLTRDRAYTLKVSGKAGSTGEYRIATKQKLPKDVPQSLTVDVKGKNGALPKVQFRVVAGTVITGSVSPLLDPIASPDLEMKVPSGAKLPLGPFSDALTFDDETWIDGVRVVDSGPHTIAIAPSGPQSSKARFVFEMPTPRGRELFEID